MENKEIRLSRAAELISNEQFTEALCELRELDPNWDNGPVVEMRGLAYFGIADYEQATTALETASLLIPLGIEAQCRLADCYMRSRRREVASVIYVHLACLEALPEVVTEEVAGGLSRLGKNKMSLQFCRAQLKRFKVNHKLSSVAAESMRRMDYPDEEILVFAYQAYQLYPSNMSYRIVFATHLVRCNRMDEASKVLHELDLDELQCVASLQRVCAIFQSLNDPEGVRCCRDRLTKIGYEVSTTYRPPKVKE